LTKEGDSCTLRRASRPPSVGAATPTVRCTTPAANSDRHDLIPVEAFLISTAVVAIGEIGDKTQLLALILAARFRKPWPIIAGILVATLVNHTLAGLVGNWVRSVVGPDVLRWLVAASFFAVALWALIPDKQEDASFTGPVTRWGIFGVTVVTFFMAEMGDKTQVATVVLAARFPSLVAVIAGTTLGMLLADVPVVLLGRVAAAKIPLKAVRVVAALIFAALGAFALTSTSSPTATDPATPAPAHSSPPV
jgi:putative Ca2+/H+ antiporter (TMEM165/GDT1 family)